MKTIPISMRIINVSAVKRSTPFRVERKVNENELDTVEVDTTVGTRVYMQQNFKTTSVISLADGETSSSLLPSSTHAKVQIQL